MIDVLVRSPGENQVIAQINLETPGGVQLLTEVIHEALAKGQTLLIENHRRD